MVLEEESWGELTEDKFEKFLAEFTKRFGLPRKSKRLAFSFWDHSRNQIDTRIRITDGQAEIMQKVGDWENNRQWQRTEQKINLSSSAEEIFNAYQILRVLIPGDDSCYIAQYDNYLFKQDNFEIKLTHQSGKTDKYNFEVEVITSKTGTGALLEELGLVDLVIPTDAAFWHQWNVELNLRDVDLTEKQIKELIEKYLTI